MQRDRPGYVTTPHGCSPPWFIPLVSRSSDRVQAAIRPWTVPLASCRTVEWIPTIDWRPTVSMRLAHSLASGPLPADLTASPPTTTQRCWKLSC